jgi:hypothetical protein
MAEVFIGGGRLYFAPVNKSTGAIGEESEIGYVQDISLDVETQTAELISRDNGAAEVVAEAVTKRDYTITFTTGNVEAANKAKFLFASQTTKIYVAGNTYRNGKTLSNFSASESYAAGDTVIQGASIYEAIGAITAGAFDADEWIRLGNTQFTRLSAGKVASVIGKLRFDGVPLDGKKTTLICHKVSLSPSGSMAFIGDEYQQLVFTGKCQKNADGDNIFVDTEDADE